MELISDLENEIDSIKTRHDKCVGVESVELSSVKNNADSTNGDSS